jgi:integrase/recombinase XerD
MTDNFALGYLAEIDHSANLHQKKARQLSAAELDQLFNAAPNPFYKALWAMQYFAASRISETLLLEWRDLDFEAGTVTFRPETTKGEIGSDKANGIKGHGKGKKVTIPPYAWEAIAAHKQALHHRQALPSQLVFKKSRSLVSRVLKQTSEGLGLEGVSTHTFRRSFVRIALESGLTATKVREFTGHQSTSAFLEYH